MLMRKFLIVHVCTFLLHRNFHKISYKIRNFELVNFEYFHVFILKIHTHKIRKSRNEQKQETGEELKHLRAWYDVEMTALLWKINKSMHDGRLYVIIQPGTVEKECRSTEVRYIKCVY